MKVYGYVRVSSVGQHEDRQLLQMKELGIEKRNIYIDKQSGKDFQRPMYRKLLRKLKCGDVLYITSLDRLGRNYEEMQKQWQYITKEIGAHIVVLDMEILDTRKGGHDLTSTFIVDIVLSLLSYVAENERNNIKQRQKEGIEAARIRGVRFGRPNQNLPVDFDEVYYEYLNGNITVREAADKLNMPKSSFYNNIKRMKEKG